MQTTAERNQLKAMKEEINMLKLALSDAHLDLRLEKAWVKLACDQAGIEDIDTFKKKQI